MMLVPIVLSLVAAQGADDPVLRKKVDALLRDNPGKSVLVLRVHELRDGKLRPVTKGFRFQIDFQGPDPKDKPFKVDAGVDSDGTLLFVIPPGAYRCTGYGPQLEEPLRSLSFVWEFENVAVKAGEMRMLADAVFAPWMEWTAPEEKMVASLKDDPKISWKPYPEVRGVELEVQGREKMPDGLTMNSLLGSLRCECPEDSSVPLSRLLKALRKPVKPGEIIRVELTGRDKSGRPLTSTRRRLEITVKE